MTRQLRVFFYVQHLLGIGHLARASRVCSALAFDGFDVTVVTGGTPVPGFPASELKHVALPPVVAGDKGFSGLADETGKPVDDDFRERRRNMLLDAFRTCDPDVVIFEAFPFGRRQMRFELMPLLDLIEASNRRPLVATSLRDILQERNKPGRAEEMLELVQAHFDLVLVHGDPAFARLEETFPYAREIADKVAYTGLVAGSAPALPLERFDVVVSAGGGAVGKELIGAGLEAAKLLPPELSWCLVTGPNLPQVDYDAFESAAPGNVKLFRFRRDFASLLSGARLSVSQAGYNTVCDIIRAGCASLLIPFTAGGETEQSTRAARLEKLGLAGVLPEHDVSPARLARDVETQLARAKPAMPPLDLEGAAQTAAILRAWLLKAPVRPSRSA
ncbi:UDP-N-acetylglucosamine--N-acetylmuramyl-(pentapeptide) pyrophosphoryl-undecaprenol N-acetylglucosamine transferase [Ensifer adhaerens]|uniref:glycosyltransferase family protein n=1 Tax=Ensifer adhaerens TaxID=106592 RepID=UPI001567D887|nr:glycosyltransferase [Ensifer adhaerens]NRP22255.1 UDP-N-acetylglucosamine--N-acetylmuramyl-(pentapeptide) pyrophosphoryl-undecaprenol N-acetylglucosamine transferase [Ensifer adhaerens]